MNGRAQQGRRRAASIGAVVAMALTPMGLAAPAMAAPDSGTVTIDLLNINDFHGRIDDDTVAFAATIEKLRAADGADGDNTLLLSAGDNYGASEFASSVAKDVPTIDVLNALGLDASAVGNHEFDLGINDLKNRVIPLATFPYLGANVYSKATGKPVLDQYATFTVNGVTVGVIGAVTRSTPTKVLPSGVKNLRFGDPVAAVNRVAKQLTDGNPANGEAQVIVAEYHNGAPEGEADSTLQQQVQDSAVFRNIVQNTSPKVAVLMNGDTHVAYTWDAPVPGTDRTRPVMQTGSYGENVGQVVLTVDAKTGAVTKYTQKLVPRLDSDKLGALSNNPTVTKVQDIVQKALAYADKVGNQPVGSVSADITTAYTDSNGDGKLTAADSRDDRGSESTIGNLVATAFRDALASRGADLGLVGAGELRAELFYAGDTSHNPANTDGVVTYAEANSVLPFSNELWTVDLTGAQIVQILEEQWQPAGADHPILHLGMSDNATYTFDPSAAKGHHITSVMINGKPLQKSRTYTVAALSFDAQGGDNYVTFADGTPHNSGVLDRDAFIDYLKAHPHLAPNFARRSVGATDLPSTVRAGDPLSFSLSDLDLTSLGSPHNTTLTVSLVADGQKPITVGSMAIRNGAAHVTATVPTSVTPGSYLLRAIADPSGTTVQFPVTVTAAAVQPTQPTQQPTQPTQPTQPEIPSGVASGTGTPPDAPLMAVGILMILAGLGGGVALVTVRRRRRGRVDG